ncbi:rod shape-determining protein MreD [bacterium SCSIO 12741]|nr:rod shape-determining protein MreD [bacterium SCSIO 12741]
MISSVWSHAARFVFLVLLQGLILNNVSLFGFVSPYLYILFILLLPVDSSPSLVLILSLVLGLSVDMFSATWGMHMAACIFIAYLRPFVLQLLSPRDGYEFGATPDFNQMGINRFLTYAVLLTVMHHLALYLIEVFRFGEILFTIGRAMASATFTIVLILLAQVLTYRR